MFLQLYMNLLSELDELMHKEDRTASESRMLLLCNLLNVFARHYKPKETSFAIKCYKLIKNSQETDNEPEEDKAQAPN